MYTLVGLLDPLIVKDITLRNRIVMPPMQSGRASFEGAVTNRLINFYVRRSSALGLPIVEHAYVSQMGKIGPKQLGIYHDSLIDGFEKLASGIHSVGAPAVVQISHAGGVANKKVIGDTPVGPSDRDKMRMLEKAELHLLINSVVFSFIFSTLSHVLIKRNSTLGSSLYFSTAFCIAGKLARHGPHHVAQKSTITTLFFKISKRYFISF